ncbi:hypothetical protein D3C80_1710920 [compost metagenome]
MLGKPLLLQLFKQPLLIKGLGEIQRFKQAVQEGSRCCAAREGMRCERWLTVQRLFACGIDIQPWQQILHQTRPLLLQAGVTGHTPEILHWTREAFCRQFG